MTNIPTTESLITGALLKEITGAIDANKPVRKKLPGGGRLHIDRQLPFLCVFRRRGGDGVDAAERLLLGSPSYLLVDGDPRYSDQLNSLLTAILKTLGKYFDRFCLLELWLARTKDPSSDLSFDILSPAGQTPQRFLEELENALLHIRVSEAKPRLKVRYPESVSPLGLTPLLSAEQRQSLNCIALGLAVSPVYLDADSGEELPFRLAALHQGLNRALKRGFFAFIHHHTRERPRHFHELGGRTMTAAVWDTDRQLAEISNGFDLLLYVSPVNSSQAWREFETQRFECEPDFLYRARNVNPSLLKRALFQIPIEQIEDPTLAHIFAEKRNELDRQLTLVADRNTPRFLLGSRQIYGDVEDALLAQARELLVTIAPSEPGHSEDYLDAAQIADLAHTDLAAYRARDPGLKAGVSIRDDVPGILVSHGNLLIGSDARVTRERAKAIINHEVGTHIVTHHNGNQQPFRELYVGMAGYEALQEGLAVLAEYLVGGLSASRLRLLAGRVLAVHYITTGAGFIDCFRALRDEHGFSTKSAFDISMRIFRGGGYTKDVVYLRGLGQLLEVLAAGHALESLYLGKIAYDYLDLIDELQWRQIVKPPVLRPLFLDSDEAQPRVRALAEGLSITELIEA